MRFGWIVLLLAASARGDVVTYEFSGTVQRTFNGDVLFGDLPVRIGDVFAGTVSYDTETSDSYFFEPTVGLYRQSIVSGLSFTVGGRAFTSSWYEVEILDGVAAAPAASDAFLILTSSLLMEGVPVDGVFSLGLVDPTAAVYSDDTLPGVVRYEDFDPTFNVSRGDLSSFNPRPPTGIAFSIDRFRLVPEPGSLALLGCGLAGLFAIRRRA